MNNLQLSVNNKTNIKHDLRSCLIHTLEGVKQGVAYQITDTQAIVKSYDFAISMTVTLGTFDRKYECEEIPTFYTC